MKLENKLRKLFRLQRIANQLSMLLTSHLSLILMEQKHQSDLSAAFSWEEVLELTSQVVIKHYGWYSTKEFKRTLKQLFYAQWKELMRRTLFINLVMLWSKSKVECTNSKKKKSGNHFSISSSNLLMEVTLPKSIPHCKCWTDSSPTLLIISINTRKKCTVFSKRL